VVGVPERTVLAQRGVGVGTHLGQQRPLLLAPDTPRTPRAWRRCHAAGLALLPAPALDRRRPDAEQAGGLGLAEAGGDGPKQPFAEVDRVLLHWR
jgi:hypothetical protein